jgi:hypothetical protein
VANVLIVSAGLYLIENDPAEIAVSVRHAAIVPNSNIVGRAKATSPLDVVECGSQLPTLDAKLFADIIGRIPLLAPDRSSQLFIRPWRYCGKAEKDMPFGCLGDTLFITIRYS